MAWDSKLINFGVIKIEGKSIKLYENAHSYSSVHVGEEISSANWAGGELNVTLKNGKVRRYQNQNSYNTI